MVATIRYFKDAVAFAAIPRFKAAEFRSETETVPDKAPLKLNTCGALKSPVLLST